MKITYYINISLFLFISCRSKAQIDQTISYEQLTTTLYNKVDTIFHRNKNRLVAFKYYIIFPYENNINIERKVDSIVCNLKPNELREYYTYEIHIFRRSVITNNETIEKNPREFDRYSVLHDNLFKYRWSHGNSFYKEIFDLKEYPRETKDTFNCHSIW